MLISRLGGFGCTIIWPTLNVSLRPRVPDGGMLSNEVTHQYTVPIIRSYYQIDTSDTIYGVMPLWQHRGKVAFEGRPDNKMLSTIQSMVQ